MPTYEYKCSDCGHQEDIVHSIKETPDFYCPKCKDNGKEIRLERLIGLSQFIIKGGSEAIHWKEKRLKMKKNAELGVKQIDRYGTGSPLKPNVAGVETDSWSDAAKLAREAGINTTSYEPMIEKEKRTSKINKVDDGV